jgi:hypothetical protein
MRAIFISYRRDDSEGHAGRLYDDLAKQFGSQSVFMDVSGIYPGVDFRNVINDKIASCGVLLAVIGPGWLDAKDDSGHRRLDNPADFHLETAAALKRGIPVVPVLVHGARMPKPEQLPEDLGALAYRNAVELTHARWESDVMTLAKSLDQLLSDDKPAPPVADLKSGTSLRGKLAVAIAVVLAIIAIVAIIYRRGGSPAPTIKSFSVSPTEVKQNGTVTIRWDVLNADSVELEPFGQLPPSGRVADQPKSNTFYKLTATNASGAKVGSVEEVIVDLPNVLGTPPTPPPAAGTATPATPLVGDWSEVQPKDAAHPMHLRIVQSGSELAVFVTYTQVFGPRPFLQAPINGAVFTASLPQGCAPSFQRSGYNYSNPGQNVFKIGLRGQILVYEQVTTWTSPCDGHEIGTNKPNISELQRASF